MDPTDRKLMERLVRAAEKSKPLSAGRGIMIILIAVFVIALFLLLLPGR